MNKKEFITAVAGYVDKYASAYGILVHSSVIAQAILESGVTSACTSTGTA